MVHAERSIRDYDEMIERAARIASADPPCHLVLGMEAPGFVREKLTVSTDFDG
jgi:hypothetical protein